MPPANATASLNYLQPIAIPSTDPTARAIEKRRHKRHLSAGLRPKLGSCPEAWR
jgi:hypothetical protein